MASGLGMAPGYVCVKERENEELFFREIPASFLKKTNKIVSCFMFLTQLFMGCRDATTTHITPDKGRSTLGYISSPRESKTAARAFEPVLLARKAKMGAFKENEKHPPKFIGVNN
ncbi:hypothetical protein AVEN_63751-1 [Araneus ventricosus]|uniref:Uncharacterized protein n=1 Tax=Araneus ventricosus TaxID=182803 RepID=A0A4Y2TW49_ARAVE|nr:hypothetical protein AVEN_63751-1 [Araneus ventricosus]